MKPRRWHSCSVLSAGPAELALWQFQRGNGQPHRMGEHRQAPDTPLPPRLARRSWRELVQRRLNIAWLPPGEVFLRVLHLPPCDPKELAPMVELQLEKISPLPVHQILWSIEPAPRPAGHQELQTVVVIIAARDLVESYVGKLESAGYLPDILEVPLLHQLLSAPAQGDAAWLYLQAAGSTVQGLTAWWSAGVLQNLDLFYLPDTPQAPAQLKTQLARMTWAGELEGWLPAQPQWRLIADPQWAGPWQAALEEWSGSACAVAPALPEHQLAALSAQRAAAPVAAANLLPAEYSQRYRQQFIDRIWMGGLGSIILIYIVGILAYFGAVEVLRYKVEDLRAQVDRLAPTYTNALQLNAKAEILQEQVDLKYAALDCWKAASDLLPENLYLLQFTFQGGRTLTLQGTVPADSQSMVTEYNSELKKAVLNNNPLFQSVDPPSFSLSGVGAPPGGASTEPLARWVFKCELNTTETQ